MSVVVVVVPGRGRIVRIPTPTAVMLASASVLGAIPPKPPEPARVESTRVFGGTVPYGPVPLIPFTAMTLGGGGRILLMALFGGAALLLLTVGTPDVAAGLAGAVLPDGATVAI